MNEKIIKNRVIKQGQVKWRELKFLQKDSFKSMSQEEYDKLKNSIINNDFVESFKVWEDGKDIWVLDGVHRCKTLEIISKEIMVPEYFSADFLDCKNKKEAAKLVTVYSSRYARVTDEGLYEFLNDYNLDFEELKAETDIADIDYNHFNASYLENIETEIKEKELDENLKTEKECPSCGYKF